MPQRWYESQAATPVDPNVNSGVGSKLAYDIACIYELIATKSSMKVH